MVLAIRLKLKLWIYYMAKTRFKPGDILNVHIWDVGDEKWQDGIVQIVEWIPPYKHTKNGVYKFKRLSGNATFTIYNAVPFDNEMYTIWLGNIYEDKALRILYGK